ncbi:MAG: hypothetical protein ACJA0Q_001513 [Saprospiraceae bacterium]|jgi:hypothetical protein
MKNIKYIALIASCIAISACSKDRITHPSFEPMDDFYNKHKVEEQEFIIENEDSSGPIIGNQGTKLYMSKRLFKFSDRADVVDFPYTIKLVELYKNKDVIFYQFPTPHSNGALNNGGEIRVRAYKNHEELVLKTESSYSSSFSSTVTEQNMNPFQGTVTSDDKFSAWNAATDGSTVVVSNSEYAYTSFLMGWITPAVNKPGSGTGTINFTVNGSGGEFIDLALVFKDFHCVLTGNALKLEGIPVGESATVIGMAMDQDGEYRLHRTFITTSSSMDIELKMNIVTEADLLNTLEGL